MLAAVIVLPSSGWALVTVMIFVPGVVVLGEQRCPQRAKRLAEVVRHVRRGEQRVLVAAHRRHQAEERLLETQAHVLGRLDGVVQVVEAERDADCQCQPDGDRHQPGPRAGRGPRRFGRFRDVDVVGAAVARNRRLRSCCSSVSETARLALASGSITLICAVVYPWNTIASVVSTNTLAAMKRYRYSTASRSRMYASSAGL